MAGHNSSYVLQVSFVHSLCFLFLKGNSVAYGALRTHVSLPTVLRFILEYFPTSVRLSIYHFAVEKNTRRQAALL